MIIAYKALSVNTHEKMDYIQLIWQIVSNKSNQMQQRDENYSSKRVTIAFYGISVLLYFSSSISIKITKNLLSAA